MNRRTINFEKVFRGKFSGTTFVTVALLLAASAPLAFAQNPAPQQAFSSPEKAANALVGAVRANDDAAMMKILGCGRALVTLEDEAQNKRQREQFVNKYQEMHRLVREPDRTVVLYIGAENWPFPVPLVASNGTWHFDAKTGMREVLYRRIGENETKAIDACHALVEEKQAQSSQEGGSDDNPLSTLLKTSNNDSANNPDKRVQFDGYYFRALAGSNKNASGDDNAGPSYIAYPVEYRKSGVMTFIVSDDGVVYEKDLGPNTGKLAITMKTYNPDSTWQKAE